MSEDWRELGGGSVGEVLVGLGKWRADAKCYQATVELVEPPRTLTEEMLRDYLVRFMEHVEVDNEEYAR
jgi:hypothetical protein